MQQKYIAIGVAVVVALAAIGGGIALVANQNDDSNGIEIPDVSGKWNLAYIESAKLSDDDEKPIYDPESIEMIDHHVNPYEPVASLEFEKVGDHGFTGKFTAAKVTDIAGTINGPQFKFAINKDGHIYVFEGSAKGEGYISCALTVINQSESTPDSVVCVVSYMLFVRDGGEPVPTYLDYFDMGMMRASLHVGSTLHMVSDFTTGERTGEGKSIGHGLKFEKIHRMISIFTATDENNAPMGIQAVVSMGATPNGTVSGILAGNLKSIPDQSKNWSFTGNVGIANGRAVFIHHLIPPSTGMEPVIAEIVYNVPYQKGGGLTPVYISNEHEYKGTMVLKTKEGSTSREITKKFNVFDNTFYSESVNGGNKVVWFGEIYGHLIDLHVLVNGVEKHGRITGHVDREYNIHLFGMVFDPSTKTPTFMEITLELVK